MTSRKTKSSFGRDSSQGRTSVGPSTSKLPRSTPRMLSARKVPPSLSKSVSKRSSYFGGGDHHVQKDIRPLSDKSYMRRCINELIAFMTDQGYPHPLTYKMMNPPTNKEYFRMVEFVFALISPGYKMMVRPEEETSKILSDLNYPCNISKSTLNNIGAMSAWPVALGALDWLVDLVKYSNDIDEFELKEIIYAGDKKREARDEYLKSTYTAFMQGENAPFTEIDDALDKQIVEMNRDVLVETEELQVLIEKQDSEKRVVVAEKEAVANMEQEVLCSQKMTENIEDYLNQLDNYTGSVKEKCIAGEAKLREMEEMASQMEQINKDMQSTVTGQELSVAEVQNIQIEIGEIENKIKATEIRCKQLQDQQFARQIEQSKLIDQISALIVEYTEICTQLELIPFGAPKAEGVDYSLSTEKTHLDKNVDKLLTVIRPKLMEMKSTLLKENGKLQQERNHSNDLIEQLREEMADKKGTEECHQKQLNNLRIQEQDLKAEMERIKEKERQDLDSIKDDIKSLKMMNSVSLEDVKSQAKLEETKLKEATAWFSNQEDKEADSLIEICTACLEYKQKTAAVIADFNKKVNVSTKKYSRSIMDSCQQLQQEEEKFGELEKNIRELCEDAGTNAK